MNKLFLFICFGTLSLGMVSCGDDEVSCSTREQQLTIAVLNLFEPSFNYDADASTENCETLRDAIQEALDKADAYRNCVPEDEIADFEADYDAFTDTLNDLPC